MSRVNRSLFVLACIAAAVLSLCVPPSAARADETATSVTRATLANGLRVIIVRDPLAPVVNADMVYLVGSDETPAGYPGMAHAQEHMAFGRGMNGLSADQLADIGTLMGSDDNAETQNTITQYFYTVPAKDLPYALHVFAIQARGVLDSQAEWAQERGAIEQEVARDLSNPFYRFFAAAQEHMFAGTPYAHDALGTRPSFDKTTGAMLKQFYDTWYYPNNAVLVITGDIDAQATLTMVKTLFANVARHNVPARPAVRLQALKAQTIALDSDQPFAVAFVGYRLPGIDSPDFAASTILGDVLASQRGDIYALGPEGKALQAGFFPGATLPKSSAGFTYAALPPGADTKAMAQTLKDLIDAYKKSGVPADLVDAAKRKAVAQAEFDRNSISGLAQTWVEATTVFGLSSPDEIVRKLQAVSVDDVNRVLRKYFDNSTALVGILNPKPAGQPSTAKGFGGVESFAPTKATKTTLPSWAQGLLATASVPNSTLSPVATTLPNGLKLIVQTEHISPTVTVVGQVKNNPDLQTPVGQEGVDGVLDGMFDYGTTTLDRIAYRKALDDIGADASAGTDFSLSVLSSQFDRGMQLLADGELHPALPATAFPIVQQQTAGYIGGQLTSPDYLTEIALTKALYPPADPQQREPTPDTVKALTLDDVKAYYQKVFRPDLTAIVVIGDITPDDAKASVEKWFGGWTATGPTPQTDYPAAPNNGPASVNVPATGRVQDSVTLKETIGVLRSDPDYYTLRVGGSILGGGFYSSRLSVDVRQKAGLVYSIAQSFDIGKTRSTFGVDYGCDPPNVSKARALIEKDVRDMQTTVVSSEELQRSKTELLASLPLSESSEQSVALGLLRRTQAGLPLDEPVRAANRYVATTGEQVRDAFAKWIRIPDLVQVVTGPAPK
ncbi:MAG: insulinase family protein [Candidatus Eremiobacteraeota bacterium]|nr:insulinase family protein [Candidatus Eremiobacteraeota bacterium]MBV8365348.1 insulinase family protein [Candidatus Eremiobacteraeota bacterium]